MSLGDSWEAYILQHIFMRAGVNSNFSTGGLPASPTAVFFSLHSADPTNIFSSAQGNELYGLNYARATLPTDVNTTTHTNFNALDFPSSASRLSNKLAITFPTATGDWNGAAAIGFFGVWTVAAAGTQEQYIGSGVISPSVTVLSGKTLSFAAGTPGNMQITID